MEKNKSKIADWLEDLQRESWQMELLISGFTIFLLLEAGSILTPLFSEFNFHTNFSSAVHGVLINFMGVAFLAIYALAICLIMHIALRGFWIAAVGLRSVQQDTDIDKLNYGSFFTKKLKQKVPSLDKLIERLDVISSVVFAFAFLLVFMFISFGLWVCFVNLTGFVLNSLETWLSEGLLKSSVNVLSNIIGATIFITSFIYFLDTLSLGFFKKYNWLGKLYYPFYKFWGWITMASIYRSIYYNLISRFPKNNLRFLLTLFIVLMFMYPFNRITFYKYYPDHAYKTNAIISSSYDNLRGEEERIWRASIPSEVIIKNYLPVFIRYDVDDNEVLDTLCTDYTPTKEGFFISGMEFNKGFRFSDPYKTEEDADKLLGCLSSLYQIYINDSLYTQQEFFFHEHPSKEERGLKTIFYTGGLPKGKNTIKIDRYYLDDDKELQEKNYVKIPFWLEKPQQSWKKKVN